MKKFNFSFKFLDRFKRTPRDEDSNEIDIPLPEKSSSDEVGFSDENPEEFAEKTLSSINIEKFREENPPGPSFDSIDDLKTEDKTRDITRPDLQQETFSEQIQEAELPIKPEVASKFRFRFPKFGGKKARDEDVVAPAVKEKRNLKDRFSSASSKTMDKFSWNDFILRLFSPYTRARIHGIFIILLVVTFTYLIGKSIALFIGRGAPIVASVKSNITVPIEKADTSLQDINRISSTNLFNIKESDKVAKNEVKKDIASIICTDAEKPTSEPLKLLDTIVLQDSVKSVASVQVRGGSDLFNVREGENLNETVEIAKINRMKVILKNLTTGDCEYLSSEEEEALNLAPEMKIMSSKKAASLFKSTNPSIKNVGNSFKIKRQLRDKLIGNMSEVLTQAKAVQITNPDGSLAFKMTEVVPGSIYANLNIQNDDIITTINGKKIENLNELTNLLGRIKEIDQFQIGMKRNGMNETLDYNFE